MDPKELRFLIDRSKEIYIALMNPKKRDLNLKMKCIDLQGLLVTADKDLPLNHIISESEYGHADR